ncbi:MAG: hypothetical protein GX267_12945 [Fibrobacter sp.]|jgi:hypothetical protein|nr:hypothetical protein [Fibrobacter sp.]
MQFLKVSCTRCSHYQQCSQKTRFFVNYCGSNSKRLEEEIRSAVNECRNRRGSLFTQGIKVQLQPITSRQTVLG